LLERQDGLPHRVVVGPVIPPEPSWPAVVIDVDGSLLSREPARSAGLLGWFHNGGAAMWPLALVALLACAVICERLVFLLGSCLKTERILAVEQALAGEDPDKARSLCADGGAVGRVLAAGLADINATVAQREAALEAALLAEAPRLERGLGLLAALGAVAPLLGLLGTVTGMIATFETIAVHGTGNPRLLSGGIGIALITTQAGLLIAVPVLLAHALIGRVIERRLLSLEGMAVALLAREQADRPSVEGGR
jgi:biopolymer transport protein ExbB